MRAIIWKMNSGAATTYSKFLLTRPKSKHAREQMIESLGEVDDAIMRSM